ncbi:hypothetical protein DCS_02188 [Drechmeria coniospora]|uniref:Uncharacterized protein n=1 Tax=Drechmeria coniospora TaxID=98403 RepID=A0A151GVC6_DRECN|nr:hypothetical protein DCS_02188 [Drechmeria coniospora]KYK61048.1 hypothetical protein DCS_02188 [Drechmeria coniospora]
MSPPGRYRGTEIMSPAESLCTKQCTCCPVLAIASSVASLALLHRGKSALVNHHDEHLIPLSAFLARRYYEATSIHQSNVPELTDAARRVPFQTHSYLAQFVVRGGGIDPAGTSWHPVRASPPNLPAAFPYILLGDIKHPPAAVEPLASRDPLPPSLQRASRPSSAPSPLHHPPATRLGRPPPPLFPRERQAPRQTERVPTAPRPGQSSCPAGTGEQSPTRVVLGLVASGHPSCRRPASWLRSLAVHLACRSTLAS